MSIYYTQTLKNNFIFAQQHCYNFPKNLTGFEPWSSVPEAAAMSTAPPHHAVLPDGLFSNQKSQFG
jgi:hypothetical protein